MRQSRKKRSLIRSRSSCSQKTSVSVRHKSEKSSYTTMRRGQVRQKMGGGECLRSWCVPVCDGVCRTYAQLRWLLEEGLRPAQPTEAQPRRAYHGGGRVDGDAFPCRHGRPRSSRGEGGTGGRKEFFKYDTFAAAAAGMRGEGCFVLCLGFELHQSLNMSSLTPRGK